MSYGPVDVLQERFRRPRLPADTRRDIERAPRRSFGGLGWREPPLKRLDRAHWVGPTVEVADRVVEDGQLTRLRAQRGRVGRDVLGRGFQRPQLGEFGR